MTVKLRLARWGVSRNPFYGIVAANVRAPRDGRHLERLGTYNPVPENKVKHIELNYDRIKYWLGVGAQPTDRVAWLLAKAGLMPVTAKQQHRQGLVSLNDYKTWDVVIRDSSEPNAAGSATNGRIVSQEEARAMFSASSAEGQMLARIVQPHTRADIEQHLTRKEVDNLFKSSTEGDTEKTDNHIHVTPNNSIKAALTSDERLILLRTYMGVF